MIYAVLNKPRGRGSLRHWQAFAVDTKVQSYVENFMLSLGFDCSDYFLNTTDQFTRSNEYPYHLLKSDGKRDLMIFDTPVKVMETKKGMRYTIIWENEE